MNNLHARIHPTKFKVLIICLQSAKYQWEQMLYEWADWLFFTEIINTRSDIIRPIANVIIVNYETYRAWKRDMCPFIKKECPGLPAGGRRIPDTG